MSDMIQNRIWRCLGHDYSEPCIYEITMGLDDWQSGALGEIVVDAHDAAGVPTAAHCALTPLGQSVADCWEAIPKFYPQIKIIGKQVMPEHFHGLLWVRERLDCHLGQVIKGFKTGCNKAARALLRECRAEATMSPQPDSDATGPAARGQKPFRLSESGGLWRECFQDTILRREGQLANMMRYLRENPLRRAIKMANPQLFHRVAEIELNGLCFSALGNRHLLERPMVQVQCSRRHFAYRRIRDAAGKLKIVRDATGEPAVASATREYRELHDAFMAAARKGAVLLSPCISDGERQIAREALAEGLALVAMRNMGFGRLEKPSGRLFEACAAGRYLMLAPAAWPYTPAQKPMTREDATAMNRLCQWLAGDGAAAVNYHGMRPADIDALARVAATSRSDSARQRPVSATRSPRTGEGPGL